MGYVNRGEALREFRELIQADTLRALEYMPQEFNERQKEALELFKQRIFLEEVIEETVTFNKKLSFNVTNESLGVTTTVEELIEVFKLRSEVYTDINYQKEFPDTIEGLNFDRFDKTAAIVFYRNSGKVTATTRLIFDHQGKLPTEGKYSFDGIREKYNVIGELSRLMVKSKASGLNQEFKQLTVGVYEVYKNNEVDLIVSGIKREHYKLYSKFGGFNIEQEMDSYGLLKTPFLITSWDPSKVSKFFKRAFLDER